MIAGDYGNRAAFIHVEIFKSYEEDSQVVNRAAADWLSPRGPSQAWLRLPPLNRLPG